jgi:hypothetical protein
MNQRTNKKAIESRRVILDRTYMYEMQDIGFPGVGAAEGKVGKSLAYLYRTHPAPLSQRRRFGLHFYISV